MLLTTFMARISRLRDWIQMLIRVSGQYIGTRSAGKDNRSTSSPQAGGEIVATGPLASNGLAEHQRQLFAVVTFAPVRARAPFH